MLIQQAIFRGQDKRVLGTPHGHNKTPPEDGVWVGPRIQVEEPPIRAAKRLRLGDFAALYAAGAYANALCRAIDQGLHRLQVHVPAPTRHVVRVRDVIAKLRAFAANIAYLCHCSTPNLVCIVPPQPLSGVPSATPSPAHFA